MASWVQIDLAVIGIAAEYPLISLLETVQVYVISSQKGHGGDLSR